MKKAFTIIRVSGRDQLKGNGPDAKWEDDVLPNAPVLGLEVSEQYRCVIQESASGWNRPKFEAAVNEAIELHKREESSRAPATAITLRLQCPCYAPHLPHPLPMISRYYLTLWPLNSSPFHIFVNTPNKGTFFGQTDSEAKTIQS